MSACSEWWMVWLTGGLFLVTWISTWLLWRNARNEFITTHRPRLRIRNFSADHFGQGVVHDLHFNIFNIGDSAATNIRISYAYLWAKDISDVILLFENSPLNLFVRNLKPGQITAQSAADLEWEKKNNHNQEIVYQRERRFFIVGRAIYSDMLGVERNTGFLREAEISEIHAHGTTIQRISGFKKADDSDYDFED